MAFIDELQSMLDEECNAVVTENGAVGYRTTGKPLLDLHFSVSSLRNLSEAQIAVRFAKAFFQDKLLAVKWLFFAADVRQGMGERRLLRAVLQYLAHTEPNAAKAVIPLVPEYSRFDNLLCLLDTPLQSDVIALYKAQIEKDVADMQSGKPVSLCAKWLPSANATSPVTKGYAKTLIKGFGVTEKQYRKTLSALRAYLDVVEVKMSKKAWSEIDYERVPSKANLLYEDAFLRNDKARRAKYLLDLSKGEVKINASVLYPHDILVKYTTSNFWTLQVAPENPALEALWAALPDYVQGDNTTLCVCDGSGSMTMHIGNTNVSCMHVATALSIYFAERAAGSFKDKYITFSENPQLVNLSKGKTLHDKLGIALSYNEAENTNVEAVFDLILKTAVKGKMKQSELPKNILILSDMEFDESVTSTNYGSVNVWQYKKLFAMLAEKYEQYGYRLPRLVFWNICSRTGAIPIKENDLGVALVSGFSPTVLKMVLSGKLDPYDCLLAQLADERYDAVETAVKDVL